MRLWVRVIRNVVLALSLVGAGVVLQEAGVVEFTTSAHAQNIVVQGNRRIEADTIRSYFRVGPGERLDAIRIDEAYKALLATGLFEDVRISQAGGRIVVTVREAGAINRVAFEGNRAVKDEQLAGEIQSKSRGPLSRNIVRADVQRILDVYRANGRYDVHVEPKLIDQPNGRVDLVFEISEGKKTGIRNINFVGNRSYSASRLKDVIKTGETGILSFLRTNDVYDQDRIEADRELLRRFYLNKGYADVRVTSAIAEYDPATRGFSVTFSIEEGDFYRIGAISVESNVREVDASRLRGFLRTRSGSAYSAEDVEKSVESMTLELAKGGYPFAVVRPRGDRNYEARTVDLAFVVDQGSRSYIERINVRGNTRTRDHVIRREFDIGEGDAYNHAMIERAERRLKNLGFFKSVKINSEPGSAPDRVVVNVDVEEMSTGEFSISGGYSTADGFIAEVSVAERNLLGNGQFAKAAVQYGQRVRGFELSFVEPYLLGYRLAFGVDLFHKQITQSTYQSYDSKTTGGGFRFGIPVADDLTLQLRYSAYQQQITLYDLNNCYPASTSCIPAAPSLRSAAAYGDVLTSLVGYTLNYNTLDNARNPTKGLLLDFKQDFAGAGGDTKFIRTSFDGRMYFDIGWDLTGILRGQAGHIASWGSKDPALVGNGDLRILDHFFMGPNLVRGFQTAGIGPRDMTPGSTHDALGGTMYWGVSAEVQYPLFFAPKDFGMKMALFADAGSVWGYKGMTSYQGPSPQALQVMEVRDENKVRSSVGVGLVWDSPFGPLRFDYAVALTKDKGVYDPVLDRQVGDVTQAFRFSGGTRF